MQILDYLFVEAASKGLFQYHPQCKQVQLTNICFTDDLIVFTKGNKEAIVHVRAIMHNYHNISGLRLNHEKSYLYNAGVGDEEGERMLVTTGF
ncbi:hypothetical protein LINPERHAP1_LOCUS21112 [Linum perenne]